MPAVKRMRVTRKQRPRFSRKKSAYRTYAKKIYKRQGTQVGRTLGFPKMLKFKHKYWEQVNLTDSGGFVHYQFSCNGMYDPNTTGVGHQPMYYDQLAELYDHYTVIGSRVKWTIVPAGTSVQAPFKITTWINDDTLTTGAAASFSENKFAQTRICQGGVNPEKIVLYQNWSAKKFFGNVLANDELKGGTSANPIEQSHYQISFRTLDGVSSVAIHAIAEVTYIAIWRELKELGSS